MLSLDKIHPNMIFKYISVSLPDPTFLRATSISSNVVNVVDNETGYSYGALEHIEHFHKYNTPIDQILKKLNGEIT